MSHLPAIVVLGSFSAMLVLSGALVVACTWKDKR